MTLSRHCRKKTRQHSTAHSNSARAWSIVTRHTTLHQVFQWSISLSALGLPLPVIMVGIEAFDILWPTQTCNTTRYKIKMLHQAQQILETPVTWHMHSSLKSLGCYMFWFQSVRVNELIWEDCRYDDCLQRLFVWCKGTHPISRTHSFCIGTLWALMVWKCETCFHTFSWSHQRLAHLKAHRFVHLLKFYWRQLLSIWHLSLQIQSCQLFLHKFKHFPDVRSSEAFYCFWSGQTVVLCSPADTAASVHEISGAQVGGGGFSEGFGLCRTTAFDTSVAIWLVS